MKVEGVKTATVADKKLLRTRCICEVRRDNNHDCMLSGFVVGEQPCGYLPCRRLEKRIIPNKRGWCECSTGDTFIPRCCWVLLLYGVRCPSIADENRYAMSPGAFVPFILICISLSQPNEMGTSIHSCLCLFRFDSLHGRVWSGFFQLWLGLIFWCRSE